MCSRQTLPGRPAVAMLCNAKIAAATQHMPDSRTKCLNAAPFCSYCNAQTMLCKSSAPAGNADNCTLPAAWRHSSIDSCAFSPVHPKQFLLCLVYTTLHAFCFLPTRLQQEHTPPPLTAALADGSADIGTNITLQQPPQLPAPQSPHTFPASALPLLLTATPAVVGRHLSPTRCAWRHS